MRKKTVLITGSSKGLGRSLSLAFASRGYNIILHGRNSERLNTVQQEIVSHNVDCHIVLGEISEEHTIGELTARANEADIDILVNNAGMYMRKPLDEMTSSEFRKIIDINLIAPVLLTKNIFKLFKKKLSGQIININSVAGKNASALESAYCASKHGLKGFMEAFKFEALEYNVTVLDIFLGAMQTDMTVERRDSEKFIQIEEAGDFICQMSQNYASMRLNEVEILRKIY
jgi:short-subunit dehydrogenase